MARLLYRVIIDGETKIHTSNEKVILRRRGNVRLVQPCQRDVFDNFNYNPLGIAVIQVR